MRPLRQSSALSSKSLCRSCWARTASPLALRQIHISATPSTTSPNPDQDVSPAAESTLDARFEVLGAPYSLLSVSLSASQNLYTRRGTLVAVNGKAENTVSTLSLLEPISRAPLGIPFLYQKISSASPITALISAKSPVSSFAVVHLDGRLDWLVAQRNGLLAWTGHSLGVKPRLNTNLSLAHWGSSLVTGRGLLALVGKGQIYQVQLKAGEEYIVHPSNVLAYTMNKNPPTPYRFKSTSFRFQIPGIKAGLFPDTRFFNEMRKSEAWKTMARVFFTLRTWTRKTIWGDRLFLQFRGPSTILIQSRGSRLSDSLTTRDMNEIADSPAGSVQAVTPDQETKAESAKPEKPEKVTFAEVGKDGKVTFTNK
ncbi:mitochondrial biogenesis AIM24-domain-containing protein [Phyllosticta citrichinensis]|uniref:Altered inheritance of mitochondria protein 24, mitochondrial n=1 Tax=Phyllosticta citrichinensis TaxID=1130410 RepID=A0ABR1XYG1_9PEZI